MIYQHDDIEKYSIKFFEPNGNGGYQPNFMWHTWWDFHLVPSSRPVVANPGVNVKMIDIPGRNEPIDMSDWLGTYGSRSGSWEFYVENDIEPWQVIQKKIISALHGKRKCVVLGSDPLYYYEGRFAVDTWKSEPQHSQITINYQLNPFKKSIQPFYAVFMLNSAVLPQNTDYTTYLRMGESYIVPATDASLAIYVSASGATATVYRNSESVKTVASGSSASFLALKASVAKQNIIRITGNGSATLSYTEVSL